MSDVTLREVTADTVRAVCRLGVAPAQSGLVASNAFSIAQAHFEPRAWFRAIYAGETPVGFVMLLDEHEAGRCYLWRLMIAAEEQGKGYGRRALELVIERARGLGMREVTLSYVPAAGSAGDFYARLGFRETGEVDEGERVMRLELEPGTTASGKP